MKKKSKKRDGKGQKDLSVVKEVCEHLVPRGFLTQTLQEKVQEAPVPAAQRVTRSQVVTASPPRLGRIRIPAANPPAAMSSQPGQTLRSSVTLNIAGPSTVPTLGQKKNDPQTNWIISGGAAAELAVLTGPTPPSPAMRQLLAHQRTLEGRLDRMEKMEGRVTAVEHSILTSNLVQECMLNTLEQLNDSLLRIANPAPLPLTERPPPPMYPNMGAWLDRLTERFSALETCTAGISTDVAANRSQMNLVLATTNSLAAAIEGQRRELTSTRVLQQEVPVQQPLDVRPVEHEDRGFQTPHRELQEQGLQTVYPELQDRGLQTP